MKFLLLVWITIMILPMYALSSNSATHPVDLNLLKNGELTGVVVDATTKSPVPYATVSVTNVKTGEVTGGKI